MEEVAAGDDCVPGSDMDPALVEAVRVADHRSDVQAAVLTLGGEEADALSRPGGGDVDGGAVVVDGHQLDLGDARERVAPKRELKVAVVGNVGVALRDVLALVDVLVLRVADAVISDPSVRRDAAQSRLELVGGDGVIVTAVGVLAVIGRIPAPHQNGKGQGDADGQHVAGHGSPRATSFANDAACCPVLRIDGVAGRLLWMPFWGKHGLCGHTPDFIWPYFWGFVNRQTLERLNFSLF